MGDMVQELSDPIFRESIRAGERNAWELLHRRCDRWLIGRARWLADVATDAEDAVAETWRRAWRDVSRYDPRWSPTTWLAQILAHVCVDLMRLSRLRRTAALRDEATVAENLHDDDQAQTRQALRHAIEELPDRQRVVIRLHVFAHVPVAEIARLLKSHPSDVHHCLARAIQNLGRRLRLRFPEDRPL